MKNKKNKNKLKKRCDICGAFCYRNRYGDIVCPNCGIIVRQEQLPSKKKPDYV